MTLTTKNIIKVTTAGLALPKRAFEWNKVRLLELLLCLYLATRLLQISCKTRYLRLETRVLLLKCRHLRFRVRETLSKNRRQRNLFQYVCEYTHSVLMTPNVES
jgi:hypothetical protein